MQNRISYDRVKNVLNEIDSGALPEVADYLQATIGGLQVLEKDPYRMAWNIMRRDTTKVFPKVLVDLVIDLYEIAIEEENGNAMLALGSHYYTGYQGFEQNYVKAVYYYEMAAEHGMREAQENLGYCYYYGRVGEPDYEKAFHYFALGAFDGHVISLYKIGDMYLNGCYVPQNDVEAFHIYLHCLDLINDDNADECAGPVYLRLGKMLFSGRGCEKNPKSALICFQKAESYLYDMVANGDTMYQGSLDAAIAWQEKTRGVLREKLVQ